MFTRRTFFVLTTPNARYAFLRTTGWLNADIQNTSRISLSVVRILWHGCKNEQPAPPAISKSSGGAKQPQHQHYYIRRFIQIYSFISFAYKNAFSNHALVETFYWNVIISNNFCSLLYIKHWRFNFIQIVWTNMRHCRNIVQTNW